MIVDHGTDNKPEFISNQLLRLVRLLHCRQRCTPTKVLEAVLPCIRWLRLYEWKRFLLVRILSLLLGALLAVDCL